MARASESEDMAKQTRSLRASEPRNTTQPISGKFSDRTGRTHPERAAFQWRAFPKRLAAALATTVALGAFTASAQQRVIVNPSFEDFTTGTSVISGGTPPPSTFTIATDDWFPGWTSTNGEIEIWNDGFQSRTPADGDYVAELNPTEPAGLFQEVCLLNGEGISWEFFHAARTSNGAPTVQELVFEVADASGAQLQQLVTNQVTAQGANNNQSNNPFFSVTGSTTYTGPSGVQRL